MTYIFFDPFVDLSQVLILLCIEKDCSSVADVAPLVSTTRMMFQIFFIIGRFSSSISWTSCKSRENRLVQIVWTLLVWDEAHCLIDYNRNLHRNWLLKISIPLMNQLCWWVSKAGLQCFWISLMQPVQIDHWWHWRLRKELENTLVWNSCGLLPGDKHCSQALHSQ